MAYRLKEAKVWYGPRSYTLHGLERRFDRVESVEQLTSDDLARAVGRITGFPREFKIQLVNECDVEAMARAGGYDGPWPESAPRIIPEHIFASADGYTISWHKEGM